MTWTVYMLRCADGSLYTGCTNNMASRVAVHNAGWGARYTRSRRPVELVWKEPGHPDRSSAQMREAEIKRWPKARKEAEVRMRGKKIIDEVEPGFSERSDRGRRNRTKGVEFERKIAIALRAAFPNAKRLFGQSREGDEVPDVGGTPFWIECAKGSTNAIHDKLRQGLAASASSPSKEYAHAPVIVISQHGGSGETMVTMRLADFVELAHITDDRWCGLSDAAELVHSRLPPPKKKARPRKP